jgi:hypothetical protein
MKKTSTNETGSLNPYVWIGFLLSFSVLALVFLIPGCMGKKLTADRGRDLLRENQNITLTGNRPRVKIMSTGSGGMLIGTGSNAVVVDPYFTGHNEFRVLVTGIKPDEQNAKKVFGKFDEHFKGAKLTSALITHGHYSHLEDMPWILLSGRMTPNGQVLGSPTVSNTLSGLMRGRTFVNVGNMAHRLESAEANTGAWIKLNDQMRVLAIESDHAPHLGKTIHFMQCKRRGRKGCVCEHERNCQRKECRPKCNSKDCETYIDNIGTDKRTGAFRWREGATYAYLLDIFQGGGRDTVRVFIMTTAAAARNGFPPSSELKKKKVDLAILSAASFNNVDGYPENILSHLGMPRTMVVNWENFYRDLYQDSPRTTPATNMSGFVSRLKSHYSSNGKKPEDWFWLQKPLGVVELAGSMGVAGR